MFNSLCSEIRKIGHSRQIHNNFQGLNLALRELCFSGRIKEAVEILCTTDFEVESKTYSLLLQDCIFREDFKRGRRIHAQMVIVGFDPNEYLQTKLVILYSKYGDLQTAHNLFDKMPVRSLVSWNAMIAGYVQMGFEEMGLNLYYKMRSKGLILIPDQFTFSSIFRACSSLATLEQGRQAHGVMIKTQVTDNVILNCSLMDMYFKCSSPENGHLVFDKASSERNVVTWTCLISGYSQNGRVEEVLELFHGMIQEGFVPNSVTFLAVLSACSHGGLINEGVHYFSLMTKEYKIRPSGKHYVAIIDLLGRAGRLHEAYEFVKNSPQEHSVIWGALLGASRIHGDLEMVKVAGKKFFEMQPYNAGMYVVLSNTYAGLGLWKEVREIREMMRVSGVKKEPGCSWIEIQREVHTFLVGDKSHEKSEVIFEMIRELSWILKDAGYVPDAA